MALHTVIVSVAGRLTWVPAEGFWLTTFPFCEASQELVLATVHREPLAREHRRWRRSRSGRPRSAPPPWQGPDEIVRLTELSRATDAAPGRARARHLAGRVAVGAGLGLGPDRQRRRQLSCGGLRGVSPTRLGTVTWLVGFGMEIVTVAPWRTTVPAGGSWATTKSCWPLLSTNFTL